MHRRIVGAGAGLAGLASVVVLYWNVFLPRRIERELEAARADTRSGGLAVTRSPERRLDAPPPVGVTAYTATGEARDGLFAFGKLWVASSGGVLVFAESGRHERTLTWLDGLGSADCTAMTRHGRFVAVGGGDGSVTLLDGERSTVLRFATTPAAAVTALASDGARLYVATAGAGLVTWDGQRGERVRLADGGALPAQITALAIDDGRLAVGAGDGRVFMTRGGALEVAGPTTPGERGAVTALVFRGDELLIGRPFGLDRLDAEGRLTSVQTDVFVTGLALDPERRVWLGSFDTGARREDQPRRPGERVFAVRWLDGRPLAFARGGVRDLSSGKAAVDWPASALPGPMVSALASHDGAVWAGTFKDGVARFAPAGAALGPVALGDDYGVTQLNGLTRGRNDELLASTARGVLAFPGLARGLEDKQVAASAASASHTAHATNRGLTLVDRSGKSRTLAASFGLANSHATAVAWQGERLFVGTLGGLSIVDPGTPRVERSFVAAVNELPAAWVTALLALPEGMLVGTYGGGVVLIHADQRVERLGSASRVNPGALILDRGRVLIGTLDHGLLELDVQRRTLRPLDLPLGSRNITALLVAEDALWVGTELGLVRLAATRVRS